MTRLRAVRLVASREVSFMVRSKVFKAATAITSLLVVALVVAPGLMPGGDARPEYSVGVVGEVAPGLKSALAESAELIEVDHEIVTYSTDGAAEEAVREEEADAAIAGTTVILKDGRNERLAGLVTGALQQQLQDERLQAAGLNREQVAALMEPPASIDERVLEPDEQAAGNFEVGFLSVLGMFVAIGLYSQWVMSGVLEEKSTRVVEVLLGAVNPRQLVAGKVIGVGGLGLFHMLILAAVGGTAALVTGAELPEAGIGAVVTAIVWFVLGYGFYAMLSAVAASLISRQEDLQIAFLPILVVAMGSYVFSAGASQDPGGTVARVGSLVPSVAPFVMPARAAQGAVSVSEQAAAAGVMLVATWLLAMLGGRVYSGAVLRFGPRIKLREAWKRT